MPGRSWDGPRVEKPSELIMVGGDEAREREEKEDRRKGYGDKKHRWQ